MYRIKKIGVVVPAYKEELLIQETLKSVPDYVDHAYVINDTSPDRTGELITEYSEHDARVVPLTHEVNKGVGAAIVTGYKKVLEGGMIIAAMPAYNEEQFIAKTILGAQKYVDTVLVVDDGSSDATIEIAKALGAMVIQHETNKGYGGALQTIFTTAVKQDADVLIILDADGQHNPDDIPKFLNAFKNRENDLIIGSRFLDNAKDSIPGYRKVGMKVLDTATNIAASSTLPNVSDSQSGFRGYNKKAIKTISPTLSGNGMSAGSEILLHASEASLHICEVPIHVRYDLEETSSENPVKHGTMALYNIIGFISFKRPLWFFGLPGTLLTTVGLGVGIYVLDELHNYSIFHYVMAILCVLAIIFGMLLFTSGLILNSIVRLIQVNK